jgi:hypothetical protein
MPTGEKFFPAAAISATTRPERLPQNRREVLKQGCRLCPQLLLSAKKAPDSGAFSKIAIF